MMLSKVRRNHLLSQRDLAKKANVTASTIYLIEAGRTTPRISIMRQISEALGVHYSEIDEFVEAVEVGRQ